MQLSDEEFRRLAYRAVDIAASYLQDLPAGPVYQRMQETEREMLIDMQMPRNSIAGDEILRMIAGQVMPHPMGNGHPRFFGWVNSPPAMIAVITEMLAAAMNPSCAGGDHAAIYLEKCAVRWLMELLEFPVGGSAGLLVSGGSMASLTALAAARHRALAQAGVNVRTQGVHDASLRLYASNQVHGCVQKAVELLGLGSDCIRWIAVDEDFRISLPQLRESIRADQREGLHPFCIVANGGSVNTGAIDPLDELADIAGESGAWLHVDGAYGAAAAMHPDYRTLFRGLERVDSIALDPHKWLSVPVECGCVLVRDEGLLRDTFSLVPSYLRTEAGKGIGNLPWFAEYGFQQTRGFRALKLWATLAHSGVSGLHQRIAQNIELARYLESRIEHTANFELRSRGQLSIVCFRYVAPEMKGDDDALDALNKRIMQQTQSDGTAFVTNATLNGRFALRACVLHYATTEKDIDILIETIEQTAQRIVAVTRPTGAPRSPLRS